MGYLSHPGFHDLPEGTEAEDRHQHQIGQEPAFDIASPAEDFFERKCEEKAKTEVHNPVEMIPMEIEPAFKPKSKGNLRVGVVRRNGVQGEPDRNQKIRQVGERECAMRDREGHYEQDGKDIGPHPDLRIDGRNG